MTEENIVSQIPDKNEMICPLTFSVTEGRIAQTYRCSYRTKDRVWESRPVSSGQYKDAFADAFYERLEELKAKGTVKKEHNAFYFSHELGMKARARFIEKVNTGEVRAPRKNWDKNFVESGQGGRPLDELKAAYPDLYNTKTSTKSSEDTDETIVGAELDLDGEIDVLNTNEEPPAEDLEEIDTQTTAEVDEDDQEDDEESEDDDEEEAYASPNIEDAEEAVAIAAATAIETPVKPKISKTQPEFDDLISTSTATLDEENIEEIDADIDPQKALPDPQQRVVGENIVHLNQDATAAPLVTGNVFQWRDTHGRLRTSYRVIMPTTENERWVERGINHVDNTALEVRVKGYQA